jgi:hypothetical protein
VITGAVRSTTVTVKLPVPALFAASRAVAVTVVVPSANIVPLGCEYDIAVTPTASVAVAASYVTTAPAPLVASTVRFAGTLTTGAVVSRTVTRKVVLPTFPAPSVARAVTVVTPIGNREPDAGL